MKFEAFYQVLEKNKLYVFSPEDIRTFYPQENRSNIKQLLYRWLKKGWIYSLKKGLYELTYPRDFVIPDLFIANKLYNPSYVSLETALSHYSIIPEVSMAVTSITTKPTRRFKNKHGLFIYHTVKPVFFRGYHTAKYGNFEVFMAEPEKALIDYIYFKTYRNKKFDPAAERLDREVISKLNQKKLSKYTQLYRIRKDFLMW